MFFREFCFTPAPCAYSDLKLGTATNKSHCYSLPVHIEKIQLYMHQVGDYENK